MITTQGITPATKDITLYRGSTLDFVISVLDNDEEVDLSLMDNIRWRFFSSNSEDEPFIDMDITDTSRLTIDNVNQFSGRITSEETIGANIRSLNHEIIFTIDGNPYVYVSGEVITLKSPGNQSSQTGDFSINVNPISSTIEVTGITSILESVSLSNEIREYYNQVIQNSTPINTPGGFPVEPDFNIFRTNNNLVFTDIDPETHKVEDTEVTYYISTTGNDGNSGSSFAFAKRSLKNLIQELNSQGISSATVYISAGVYDIENSIGGESFDFYPNLICPNGRAIFANFVENPVWDLADGRVNIYTTPGDSGDNASVIDTDHIDEFGIAIRYTRVQGSVSGTPTGDYVEATPGTNLTGSSNIAVHTFDSNEPGENVKVFSTGINTWIQTSPIQCYMENIEFWGGLVDIDHASSGGQYFFNNCKFLYGELSNNLHVDIPAGETCYLYKCQSYYALLDGFNYGGGGTYIEVNSTSSWCGRSIGSNSNDADNGSTGHQDSIMIRINGVYTYNGDRNVHDIQDVNCWNINCIGGYAQNDSMDPYENGNFLLGSQNNQSTIGWFDSCISLGGSAGDIGSYGNGDAIANLKNCIGFEIEDGNGTIQRY